MFAAFISNAEYYGMPVAFLRAVGKYVAFKTIAENDIQSFRPYLNRLSLRQSTYDALADMNVQKPRGEAGAITGAYHEAAHAYLDSKKKRRELSSFYWGRQATPSGSADG